MRLSTCSHSAQHVQMMSQLCSLPYHMQKLTATQQAIECVFLFDQQLVADRHIHS